MPNFLVFASGKALDRLAEATTHDVANLIFACRGYSRPRMGRELGITSTRMSRTRRHGRVRRAFYWRTAREWKGSRLNSG